MEGMLARLRWPLLLVFAIIVFLDPLQRGQASAAFIVLSAGAAYNLVVMLFLWRKFFRTRLPVATAFVDALVLAALMIVTGGADSPFALFSLLPISATALRFGATGGLFAAASFGLVYEILVVLRGDLSGSTLFQTGLVIVLYLLVAVPGGLIVSQQRALVRERETEVTLELHQVQQRTTALSEMAQVLSGAVDYRQVLEAMLEAGARCLRKRGGGEGMAVGCVLLFDEAAETPELAVAASRQMSSGDESRRTPGKEGVLAKVLATAQPMIIARPGLDPELGQFTAFQTCTSALCLPLRAGYEVYGVAAFGTEATDLRLEDRQDLLAAFCSQATLALRSADLYRTVQEERDHILGSDEEARKKLARELHDGPTQAIAALAMRLNFARLLLEKEPDKLKDELASLEAQAQQIVRDIRTTLFRLRPLPLESTGLKAALEQYLSRLRRDAPETRWHLSAEGLEGRLTPQIEDVVFGVVQEALGNARKHARARDVWVEVAFQGPWLIAQVRDNGQGFDVDAVQAAYEGRTSLGMLNMQERARLVDGELSVAATPGKGTTIRLSIPLREAADTP